MSTLKTINIIHPSGSTNNIVNASDGTVGMGTTAAGGTLNVLANTSGAVALDVIGRSSDNLGTIRLLSNSAATNYGQLRGGSGSIDLQAVANIPMTFATNNTERMRIDTSGNVGIGMSSPSAKLDVLTSINLGQNYLNVGFDAGGGSGWLGGYNATYSSSAVKTVATGALSAIFYGGNGVQFFTNSSAAAGTTASERMRIDTSGNVGIGTSSPGALLELSATNANVYSAIRMTNTTGTGTTAGAGIEWARAGTVKSSITANTFGNDYMAFNVNGNTERMRIDTSGNLLVGTTNSSIVAGTGMKFDLNGTNPQIAIVGTETTSAQLTYSLYSSGASAYRFYVNYAGTIFATSTTISGISDQRLKENVRDLDVGLDAIMALKPRKFDWKEGKGKDIKDDRGFIAQEFEQVFPDLIDKWADPAPEGEEPYKSVRQDLIPVLVRAIQEQQATITALTARVAALEAK